MPSVRNRKYLPSLQPTPHTITAQQKTGCHCPAPRTYWSNSDLSELSVQWYLLAVFDSIFQTISVLDSTLLLCGSNNPWSQKYPGDWLRRRPVSECGQAFHMPWGWASFTMMREFLCKVCNPQIQGPAPIKVRVNKDLQKAISFKTALKLGFTFLTVFLKVRLLLTWNKEDILQDTLRV